MYSVDSPNIDNRINKYGFSEDPTFVYDKAINMSAPVAEQLATKLTGINEQETAQYGNLPQLRNFMYDTYWDNSTVDFIDRPINNRSIRDLFPARRACASGVFESDYQKFVNYCATNPQNPNYTVPTSRLSDKCFRQHGAQKSSCVRDSDDCKWNVTRCELKDPIVWKCSDGTSWPP